MGVLELDSRSRCERDHLQPDADTCRACGVEPYTYLLHVLTELPQRNPGDDITDLLPFNFVKR